MNASIWGLKGLNNSKLSAKLMHFLPRPGSTLLVPRCPWVHFLHRGDGAPLLLLLTYFICLPPAWMKNVTISI